MARLRFRGELDGLEYSGHPASGSISSFYGVVRKELSGGKGHTGLDIAGDEIDGAPITAPMEGIVHSVFLAQENPQQYTMEYFFGNCVVLRHDDSDGSLLGYTLYAHMVATPSVSRSQPVNEGDLLGHVGSTGRSTGPHLHWGCTVADNPYLSRSKGLNDPLNFLDNSEEEVNDVDEQQKKANDLIDAGQSILNNVIDDLQGKVDDMEND
jgi:murein DD-endopeptidase MepM/ murein hydrolase activator NlpD|tara:strand:+ start:345 stop:974 length:630 start_codon:yes stop_codon:yes gene_type:complete